MASWRFVQERSTPMLPPMKPRPLPRIGLRSPDGRIAVLLHFNADREPAFSITFDRKPCRYRIRSQHHREIILVEDELTHFCFAQDRECWGLKLGAFETGHEGEFRPLRASTISEGELLDIPLVCQTDTAALAIAEAEKRESRTALACIELGFPLLRE